MGVRRLTDAPLHVDHRLRGVPLASPRRRLAAFAIDAVLLLVPTVLASVLVAAAVLAARDPAAFDAAWNLVTRKDPSPEASRRAVRDLLPVLVEMEPRGLPHEVIALVEEGRAEEAAARLAGYDFTFALSFSEAQDEKPLPPKSVRVRVETLIPGAARGIALFFVPALYFTLFTCGGRAATPGKRIAGIRVVRLDGHPISWLEGLERFIGYLEIPGTLFVGLLDLWKEPNRRMAHDRVAHTAVVRPEPAASREQAPA